MTSFTITQPVIAELLTSRGRKSGVHSNLGTCWFEGMGISFPFEMIILSLVFVDFFWVGENLVF